MWRGRVCVPSSAVVRVGGERREDVGGKFSSSLWPLPGGESQSALTQWASNSTRSKSQWRGEGLGRGCVWALARALIIWMRERGGKNKLYERCAYGNSQSFNCPFGGFVLTVKSTLSTTTPLLLLTFHLHFILLHKSFSLSLHKHSLLSSCSGDGDR